MCYFAWGLSMLRGGSVYSKSPPALQAKSSLLTSLIAVAAGAKALVDGDVGCVLWLSLHMDRQMRQRTLQVQ